MTQETHETADTSETAKNLRLSDLYTVLDKELSSPVLRCAKYGEPMYRRRIRVMHALSKLEVRSARRGDGELPVNHSWSAP